MSHQQLGDPARAREFLTWAERWLKMQPQPSTRTTRQLDELTAFRAEAEALIGK